MWYLKRRMLEGTSSLKPAPDDPELEKAAIRWAGYEDKIKRAMKGRKGKEKGQNEDDQEFMDIVQKVDHMDKEKMTAFVIQVPGMSSQQSTEDMREILIEHLYRMKLLQHLDKEDEEKGVIFKPDWTKSSFWEEEDDDDMTVFVKKKVRIGLFQNDDVLPDFSIWGRGGSQGGSNHMKQLNMGAL